MQARGGRYAKPGGTDKRFLWAIGGFNAFRVAARILDTECTIIHN